MTQMYVDDEFVVVRNDDGMYSVWWADRPVPAGWAVVGTPAEREVCLDRIATLWTGPQPGGTRFRSDGDAS